MIRRVEPLALLGLLGLVLVKEAGLPVPVPGDLLVIGAGAALAPDLGQAAFGLALILAAGYLGGTGQFALMQRAIRRPLLALLRRVGVPVERVEALAGRRRRGGWRGVAVARMTPGVRVGAIAASGLAELPLGTFVRGLMVGNAVFVAGHFLLGFALGASAERLLAQFTSSLPALLLGVGALAAIGLVGWLAVARVRSRRGMGDGAPIGAWADAACPACLALAVIGPMEDDSRRA